jgi:dihydrofolate synthase/folylpolyglutamate synthase
MLETVPTYFEQVTAIALVAFAEAKVELAILETGLGGRLDATTATHSEIAAITRIDLDHQQYLGETIEEIAAEKAAIISRDSRAVVVGDQQRNVLEVILDRCQSFGIIPRTADDVQVARNGEPLSFETRASSYPIDKLGLAGQHQIENAKVAILVAEILQKHFSITGSDICAGLRSARHPGRLEMIGRFLLDGAHNPSGAKALAAYLQRVDRRPLTVVYGAMRDKDVSAIGNILFPIAETLILTRVDNSRSLSPSRIADAVPPTEGQRVVLTDSAADAIDAAFKTSPKDALIVITGSLYLVGEARALILSKQEI